MTLREAILRIKAIKPNSFKHSKLAAMISELENRIRNEIFLCAPLPHGANYLSHDICERSFISYKWDDSVPIDEEADDDRDTVLIVGPDFEIIYEQYLSAKIDLLNEEYDKYNYTNGLFLETLSRFAAFIASVVDPANGNAIKHGYYLKGEKGSQGPKGEKGDKGEPGDVSEAVAEVEEAIENLDAEWETVKEELREALSPAKIERLDGAFISNGKIIQNGTAANTHIIVPVTDGNFVYVKAAGESGGINYFYFFATEDFTFDPASVEEQYIDETIKKSGIKQLGAGSDITEKNGTVPAGAKYFICNSDYNGNDIIPAELKVYENYSAYEDEADPIFDLYDTSKTIFDRVSALEDTAEELDSRVSALENPTVFELENPLVHEYMTETDYQGEDSYALSSLTNADGTARAKYNVGQPTLSYIKSDPSPVTLTFDGINLTSYHFITLNGVKVDYTADGSTANVYNLIPGKEYRYELWYKYSITRSLLASGTFRTSGKVRMIHIGVYTPTQRLFSDGIYNCRDLGGWTTYDGRKVKYGKVFRSTEFDGATSRGLIYREESGSVIFDGKETLRALGVTNEIDLDENETFDPNLKLENYNWLRVVAYDAGFIHETLKNNYGAVLQNICDSLEAGRGSIFHCKSGKDRTGTVAFLLLGILGVTEDQISQDYELSWFCNAVSQRYSGESLVANSSVVTRNNYVYTGGSQSYYKDMMTYINTNYSEYATFTEKVTALALDIGLAASTVGKLRKLLLTE